MGKDQTPGAKIDKRFEGEPVQVGDRIVRPVARMTGKRMSGGSEQGGFASVALQLQPVEIVVREGNEEHTIPLADPQKASLRGIFMAGGAVCIGCILIMLAGRTLARRRLAS